MWWLVAYYFVTPTTPTPPLKPSVIEDLTNYIWPIRPSMTETVGEVNRASPPSLHCRYRLNIWQSDCEARRGVSLARVRRVLRAPVWPSLAGQWSDWLTEWDHGPGHWQQAYYHTVRSGNILKTELHFEYLFKGKIRCRQIQIRIALFGHNYSNIGIIHFNTDLIAPIRPLGFCCK